MGQVRAAAAKTAILEDFSITFTTAAFDRSSLWQFEASPYRAASKGLPSSFVQQDAFASS